MTRRIKKVFPPEYLQYPQGKDRPLPFVFQLHHRGGKSVHGDVRFDQGEALVGFTLAIQPAGLDIEGLDDVGTASVEAAKRGTRARKGDFKIDPFTGEFAARRTAAGIERATEIQSFVKGLAPRAWLKIEGVVEPGGVGATRTLPAVFWIADSGTYTPGARKASTWEVFIEDSDNGVLAGRYFWRPLKLEKQRVLPPSEGQDIPGISLMLIRPTDQTPNVLAESSRKDRVWIPPLGWSALPSFLRGKVPPSLRYWTKAGERERMRLRDALYERWKKDGTIAALERGEGVEKRGEALNIDGPLRNLVTTLPDLRRILR